MPSSAEESETDSLKCLTVIVTMGTLERVASAKVLCQDMLCKCREQ